MKTPDAPVSFRQLKVWRSACDLAIDIGNLCEGSALRRNRVLADQMHRASVSVPSNIAEGNDRGGDRDTVRFLVISRGSLAELRTQLDIALGRKLISLHEYRSYDDRCAEIGRMLSGLIKFRRERQSQVKDEKSSK
jgi:four helix bundle protein